MYYQLSYKINDDRLTDQEIINMIARLDYKYVQQLSWTLRYFIMDSSGKNIIRTLVAYQQIVKSDW